MNTAGQTSAHQQLRAPVTSWAGPRGIMTGEHALLLSQVAIRAQDMVVAAEDGHWPAGEIRALLGYVRDEVLRQASEQELRLLPCRGASQGFARLGRAHARLNSATEMLERAAAGDSTWSAARLAVVTQDLVCQLVGHLAAEECALATAGMAGEAPAVTCTGDIEMSGTSRTRTDDRPGRGSPGQKDAAADLPPELVWFKLAAGRVSSPATPAGCRLVFQ